MFNNYHELNDIRKKDLVEKKNFFDWHYPQEAQVNCGRQWQQFIKSLRVE